MNTIKKISAQGLKRSNLNANLGPLTLIAGDNWSGKTSYLDAVALALAGFHPGVGGRQLRTNADVMKLAAGPELTVHVEFDDGKAVTRNWKRKGDSVTRVDGLTGLPDNWVAPACLVDVNEYLAMSDKKRVEYVFGLAKLADGAEKPETEIAAAVKRINLGDEHTPEAEKVVGEMADYVYDSREWCRKLSAQDWLAELSEQFKKKASDAAATFKRMVGTVQGLEQLKAESTEPPVNPSVERDLSALRARRDDLIAQKATAEAALLGATKAAEKVEALRAAMESAPSVEELEELRRRVLALKDRVDGYVSRRPALTGKVAELAQAHKRTKEEIEKCSAAKDRAQKQRNRRLQLEENIKSKPRAVGAMEDVEARIRTADVQIAAFVDDLPRLKEDCQKARDASYSAMHVRQNTQRQVEDVKTRLQEIAALSCCPTCKAAEQGWRSKVEGEYNEQLDKLLAALAVDEQNEQDKKQKYHVADKLRIEAEQLLDAHHAVKERRAAAIEAKTSVYSVLNAIIGDEAELAAMEPDQVDAAADIMRVLEADRAKFWREHDEALVQERLASTEDEEHNKRVADLESLSEEYSKKHEALNQHYRNADEITQLRAMSDLAPSHQSTVDAKLAAIREANARIAEMDTEQKRVVAARASARSKQEALAAAVRVEAEAKVAKLAAEIVQARQSKMVEDAFAPILASANRLVEPLLAAPLIYRDGTIGRSVDGRFVSQATFSGAERAITCAALSVALAASSPVKLVMVDELGTWSDRNRAELLALMEKLVEEGHIDQFIGVQAMTVEQHEETERRGCAWTEIWVD